MDIASASSPSTAPIVDNSLNNGCIDDGLTPDESKLVDELADYWNDFSKELPEGLEVPQVTRNQLGLCVRHLLAVLEVNQHINLTRIVDSHDSVCLHLLDSLMLLPFVYQAPTGVLLDMGTGAGFPGLTLAICSRRSSVLMDSVGKKINAVGQIIQELGLENVSAVHDRVESYAVNHRGSCSVVVARAVAPLSVLLEYASPLLRRDGLLIVTKGVPSSEELTSAQSVASQTGFNNGVRYDFSLPEDKGSRAIFVYQKVAKPHVKLPRAIGMAKKHPLA